jgi:hypothetical protein
MPFALRRLGDGVPAAVTTVLAWLAVSLAPAAEPLLLEGYADPWSVRPGEEVRFHVSTNAREYDLEVARVGATDEVVYTREHLPGAEHPVGDDSGRPGAGAMYGCKWPAACAVRIPADWRSGFYRVVLRSGGQTRGDVADEPFRPGSILGRPPRFVMFFAVRAAEPGRQTKILLQLASNTYQAYNNWGGSSLYTGPNHPRVSFLRPLLACAWGGPCTWELPLLRWAERNGYRIDVCTNLDLAQHREMLPHYRLVLSVGHDEYWSAGMRDGLEAFIAQGGNCAFFSGNTCCWQVRVEDHGRTLVCHKRAIERDPVFKTGDWKQLSTLWSDPRLQRPENRLTGVGFVYGGYNGVFGAYEHGPGEGEYTVHRPEHWLFAGTGLKRGEIIGKEVSLAGYEMDGCEFVLQDGLPVPTGRDGTPQDLEILATAPGRWASMDSSLEWAKELRQALPQVPGLSLPKDHVTRDGVGVLGVFRRGGTVVTAGSTDWANGLAGGDPVVERITRNIFDRLGAD